VLQSLQNPYWYGLIVLGFVGPTLGLVGLLGQQRKRMRAWRSILLPGMLVVGAIVVAELNYPRESWLPLLVLAGLLGLGMALRSPAVALCVTLLARSRVQASLLLAVCPLLLVGWIYRVEQVTTPPEAALRMPQPPALKIIAEALTDTGRVVPLYALAEPALGETSPATTENSVTRSKDMKLIRTEGPNTDTDCHGWIFADGHGWIVGKDVARILHDNGYRLVEVPRAGDLVVYRDGDGVIAHTALVRVAAPDGLILLESKWGALGRFIHRPEDQCFGSDWAYYRSTRAGHLLRADTESDRHYPQGYSSAVSLK
jgi:hypothetical protein